MSNQSSWPFVEARKILQRTRDKEVVIFETGFGPSGSPHIGTFAEVVRTTMVMNAFHELSDKPARLICFSDDKDALRSVPENLPNQEMLEQHLGYSLTSVPNPFDFTEYDGYPATSFAAQNNARLRSFLDQYGFEYEFMSASAVYASGEFNNVLRQVAENVDEITAIVTSTMKEGRRKSYCPFMPVVDGKVIHDVYDWRITCFPGSEEPQMLHFYTDPADGPLRDNRRAQMVSLFDGNCKLQWYVDWAMRWCALGVDYEMHGKDLLTSAQLSDKIARSMGYEPPLHMMYELFLDEEGRKISKSKGNGMELDAWWHYSTRESLSYFMFQNPRKARKLHFDVLPQATEDYLKSLERYNKEADMDNPVWHIHGNNVPEQGLPIPFSMLLNLVSITDTEDPEIILEYIRNYRPGINFDEYPLLRSFVGVALNYYSDRILPFKEYREPNMSEKITLMALSHVIKCVSYDHEVAIQHNTDFTEHGGERKVLEEALTTAIYNVGKDHYGKDRLREFFGMVYEVVMGQKSGPRLPIFVMIYGLDNMVAILDQKTQVDNSEILV